jgi:hypothetical protein
MIMKQNITLSLDQELIHKAEALAARRSISISELIGNELARIISESDSYEKARQQALADLEQGFHMGGQKPTSRNDLHGR